MLHLTPEEVAAALARLAATDLVAVTERVVQVLPVPDGCRRHLVPIEHGQDDAQIQPACPTQLGPSAGQSPPAEPEPEVSEEEIRAQDANARAQFARFCGRREPSASSLSGVARGLALQARRAALTGTAQSGSGRGDRRG